MYFQHTFFALGFLFALYVVVLKTNDVKSEKTWWSCVIEMFVSRCGGSPGTARRGCDARNVDQWRGTHLRWVEATLKELPCVSAWPWPVGTNLAKCLLPLTSYCWLKMYTRCTCHICYRLLCFACSYLRCCVVQRVSSGRQYYACKRLIWPVRTSSYDTSALTRTSFTHVIREHFHESLSLVWSVSTSSRITFRAHCAERNLSSLPSSDVIESVTWHLVIELGNDVLLSSGWWQCRPEPLCGCFWQEVKPCRGAERSTKWATDLLEPSSLFVINNLLETCSHDILPHFVETTVHVFFYRITNKNAWIVNTV